MGRVRSHRGHSGAPTTWFAPEDLPPPQAPTQEIRDAADEIVRRPEFREPPRSLYQRVLDALSDIVGEALEAAVGGGRGVVVALVVFVVVVAFVGYLVARSLRGAGGRHRDGEERAEIERRRPAVEWEADAARAEAQGEWRTALRCRYRALIAHLAAVGLVEEVAGRTSGEYRTAFSAIVPEKAAPFGAATELFEEAWYGNAPVGPEEAASFRDLAGAVAAGSPR